VPTGAPSTTAPFLLTVIEPRWVRVTEYPSGVSIVTLFPEDGTEPANVTVPEAGASTVEPAVAPTSMPRCCAAAYGCAGSKRKGCRTEPVAGQVHALAAGASKSAASTAGRSARRIDITSAVCLLSEKRTLRPR
jgi:hypothetical protein